MVTVQIQVSNSHTFCQPNNGWMVQPEQRSKEKPLNATSKLTTWLVSSVLGELCSGLAFEIIKNPILFLLLIL